MISIDRAFSVYISLFLVFILTLSLKAQPDIDLPSETQLIVNGSDIPLTSGWIDSLVDDAFAGKICYKIVGASRAEFSVTTQVQLPQILTLNEVYRQIVLYYIMLPDEDIREREFLNIYPYFESTEGEPALRCQYIPEGKYHIEVQRWNQIPVPAQPIIEDREIYNQILQISFHELQSFGDISDNVFEKVAIKNKLPIERIREIYQNTILWQLGCQL